MEWRQSWRLASSVLLSDLMFLACPRFAWPLVGPSGAVRPLGCRSGGADPRHPPLAQGLPKSLTNQNYYILCSSAESTPIIVARPKRRKRFFMHREGRGKASKNQALSAVFRFDSPTVHRRSTV